MNETIFASRLYGQGHPPEAIAIAMPGRSPKAIENRLQRVGLWKFRTTADTFPLDLTGKLRRR